MIVEGIGDNILHSLKKRLAHAYEVGCPTNVFNVALLLSNNEVDTFKPSG